MTYTDEELDAWLRSARSGEAVQSKPKPLPMDEWLETLESLLKLAPPVGERPVRVGGRWLL